MKYCTALRTKEQRHNVENVRVRGTDFNALNAFMSMVSKEAKNTYIHTFLLIMFLIFNQFSI